MKGIIIVLAALLALSGAYPMSYGYGDGYRPMHGHGHYGMGYAPGYGGGYRYGWGDGPWGDDDYGRYGGRRGYGYGYGGRWRD